jgi:copper chaperone
VRRGICLIATGLLLLSGALDAPAADGAAEVRTTFTIEGMHCDGCSATIIGTLERMEGVSSATADHEEGVAEAVYRPKQVSAEELEAAIEKLGYTVSSMETRPVDG